MLAILGGLCFFGVSFQPLIKTCPPISIHSRLIDVTPNHWHGLPRCQVYDMSEGVGFLLISLNWVNTRWEWVILRMVISRVHETVTNSGFGGKGVKVAGYFFYFYLTL